MKTQIETASVKHTPGPWLSALEEHGDYIIYVKKDDEEPGICSCDGSEFIPIDDESEIAANARLIAAAPELLAALKAIREGFIDGSIQFTKRRQSDSDSHHPANVLMCAALERAEAH